MGRKTPISFNLQKYVDKHCNDPQRVHKKHEHKASYNTDYIVPDLIDYFRDDWKENKTQIEQKNKITIVKSIVLNKNSFVASNF